MNNYFVYEYKNKRQFISTANPLVMSCYSDKLVEIPRCIGVWKFKKINQKK